MELLWVVIVILYFVFAAISQSQKRQRAEAEMERAEPEPIVQPQPVRKQARKSSRLELPPEQELSTIAVVRSRSGKLNRRVPQSRRSWADGVVAAELLARPRGLRPYRPPWRR